MHRQNEPKIQSESNGMKHRKPFRVVDVFRNIHPLLIHTNDTQLPGPNANLPTYRSPIKLQSEKKN